MRIKFNSSVIHNKLFLMLPYYLIMPASERCCMFGESATVGPIRWFGGVDGGMFVRWTAVCLCRRISGVISGVCPVAGRCLRPSGVRPQTVAASCRLDGWTLAGHDRHSRSWEIFPAGAAELKRCIKLAVCSCTNPAICLCHL